MNKIFLPHSSGEADEDPSQDAAGHIRLRTMVRR